MHLLMFFGAGFLAAWHISGMDALQAGHTPWHIFMAGFIALCAMILPGISGSFMLVLMGQYAFILQAVIEFHLTTLAFFACGGICGLLAFSRTLSHCFSRFPHQTNGVMLGIMAGCLRLAWPWQSVGMPAWPQAIGLRESLAIVACLAGLALPIALHLLAQRRTNKTMFTE
jgi:putative membrane protein